MRSFWLEKWRARRAGKIDGRLKMEFLQEGYPPRVRQLSSDADGVMSAIARKWEAVDKPLAGIESDLTSNMIPKAEAAIKPAKAAVDRAEKDFQEVMHHAGKGGTGFALFVVILGAVAEVVVNFEPFRNISPATADWLNLIGAFAVSLVFMFLCKSSGGAAKEGAKRSSFAYGGAALGALILIAYVRGVAAEINLARLVREGEATGSALSGVALFLVSFGIPFLLGTGCFVVGYMTGPSHPEYNPRKRKTKRAQLHLRKVETSLAAVKSALAGARARRAKARNMARRRCEVQLHMFTELAMHYLEMYNRSVPPGERKPLPSNRLPAEIPPELSDTESDKRK
ncbi:MAG: hypothetical protein Q7R48_03845 [bacterium]|nr:hypothetical protein [bacterium]